MASLDGISFDVTTCHVSRTILSSVGGFSQPARQQIRSLQDLLATIQRFNLEVFDASSLRHDVFVGEGVSYKVSRCIHSGSKKLYAVKEVKLASLSRDFGAFERQVACVLRDVEVMSCLAHHNNILNIFGYGWNAERSGPIPFLVTEFAAEGTLRSFLKSNEVSLYEKLLFCKDVAQGVHSLHVSGIAHGDLKLDNVLVTPYTASTATPLQHDLFEASRTSGLSACISDFGHSLHLYDDEGDSNVKQRYGGTLAYNAPEILGEQRYARDNVNFRKCDVWSLGLLCWEVLIDGQAYYHNSDVQQGFISQRTSTSNSTAASSYDPNQALSTSILEELSIIAPQLVDIACRDVTKRIKNVLSSREIDRLSFLFQKCLEPDAEKRLVDIPLLPLLSKHDIKAAPQRVQEFAGSSWSFDIFEMAPLVPQQIRAMILSDCQKLAEEPGDSIVSARAAFQLALAHATGFVGSKDLIKAIHWFECSSAKGFHLAELYLPSLRALQSGEELSHEAFKERYFICNQQALKDKFTAAFFEGLEDIYDRISLDPFSVDVLTNTIPGARNEDINTKLLLASKFGRVDTVEWILNHNSTIDLNWTDKDGCTALHWLFMFPEDDISRLSTKLGKEHANFIYAGEIDDAIAVPQSSIDTVSTNNEPLNIDPQLPLQLAGTPLSFAIATYSKTAVKALLLMGADPLCGTKPLPCNQSVQNFSAVHVATRLNMADLLRMLLNNIFNRHLLSAPAFIRLLNGLSLTMATATPVERSIIHGSYTKHAAEETIAVLQEFHDTVAHNLRAWTLLMPAVLQADLEVCSVILAAKGFQQTSTAVFKLKELDALIAVCTESACLLGSDSSLSIEILEFGISVGASANGMFPDQNGRKPVFIAIEHHQPTILDWLIDVQHIDLNVLNENGLTPLHALVISGFLAGYSIEKLIQNGASPEVESKDNGQPRPIDVVMTDKTVPEFTALLQHVDSSEVQYFLVKAISAECTGIVTAVIEYAKKTRSVPGLDLQVALDIAVTSSSAKIVRVILDGGADPGTRSLEAFSPLHQAASFGKAEVLEVLHKAGADVNKLSRNGEGGSPLIYAIMTMSKGENMSIGARECCNYLLENGADVNFADGDGNTPIMLLLKGPSWSRNNEIIEKILEKGADPNVIDDIDHCVIFQSIMEFNYELAQMLIRYKARVDKTNTWGDTILHNCAKLSSNATINECKEFSLFDLVEKLLDAGAYPHDRNLSGHTPLDEAIYTDNGPVALALLRYFSKIPGTFPGARDLTNHGENMPKICKRMIAPVASESNHQKSFLHSASGELFIAGEADQENYILSKQTEALGKAWRKAIDFGSWSCVCAFLQTGVYGPTEYMARKPALGLFTYAIQNEISDTIIKFMGDSKTTPDPYLRTIWDSVRGYFRCHGDIDSSSKPNLSMMELSPKKTKIKRWRTIGKYVARSQSMSRSLVMSGPQTVSGSQTVSRSRSHLASRLKQGNPKDLKNPIANNDIPTALVHHAPRLQYMNSIDGYSKSMPAEVLIAMGFSELSGEGKELPELHSDPMPIPSILLYGDEENTQEDFEDGGGSTRSEASNGEDSPPRERFLNPNQRRWFRERSG